MERSQGANIRPKSGTSPSREIDRTEPLHFDGITSRRRTAARAWRKEAPWDELGRSGALRRSSGGIRARREGEASHGGGGGASAGEEGGARLEQVELGAEAELRWA